MLISLQDILDQVQAHVFWCDCHHVILGCNQAQAESVGLSRPEDLIGKRLHDLIKEPVLSNILRNNNIVLTEGKSIVVEEGLADGLGQVNYYLTQKSPLYDAEKNIVGLVGVAQLMPQNSLLSLSKSTYTTILDLVQRLGIYKNIDPRQPTNILMYLEGIKQYYKTIIDLMPGNVYWVDMQGNVLGCNQNQALSMGFADSADLLGKNLNDLFPKEEAKKILDVNVQVAESKKYLALEESSTMKDGEERTYFSTKTVLKSSSDEVIGVLGASLDITQRKVIEQELVEQRVRAEAANSSKSEFILNMSHDLRTPCSGILGFAKILYDSETDEEKKKQLKYIVMSSQHLMGLLNEIMDYTKVESSAYTVELQPVNIRVLINNVMDLLMAEFKRKGLALFVDCPNSVPEYFLMEPMILHRVLLNLTSNALKFTPQGSVRVKVQWKQMTKEMVFSIIDTGIGIEGVHHASIFERFSRVSASYEGGYQGAGLGLSTVKCLLESLGGHITVKSELGKGSEFTFVVPAESCDLDQDVDHEEELGGLQLTKTFDFSHHSGWRVLIIEDDHISREMCQFLFEAYDVQLVVVTTGEEAINIFHGQYDLIMVDIGLPDMTGFEIVKYIREWESRHAKLTPVDIVALTAHIDKTYGEQCFSSGFNGLMQKPLTKEKIELL